MRTFIAIELSPAVQKQINQVQFALQTFLRDQQIPASIRWTPVTKIHLTLRFLGETSESQRAIITRDLSQIGLSQPTFALTLGSLGCFPNFHAPNVVWLGLQGDLAALQHVQRQIEQVACEADFAPENRPFAPHITLGRAGHNSNQAELRRTGAALQHFSLGLDPQQRQVLPIDLPVDHFVVNQIVHMQSELQPEGARYTPLRHYRFGQV